VCGATTNHQPSGLKTAPQLLAASEQMTSDVKMSTAV